MVVAAVGVPASAGSGESLSVIGMEAVPIVSGQSASDTDVAKPFAGMRGLAGAQSSWSTARGWRDVVFINYSVAGNPPQEYSAAELEAMVANTDMNFSSQTGGAFRFRFAGYVDANDVLLSEPDEDPCLESSLPPIRDPVQIPPTAPGSVETIRVYLNPMDCQSSKGGLGFPLVMLSQLHRDSAAVLAHEVGHNLNLEHANGVLQSATGDDLETVEYGDLFSLMGHHLTSGGKWRLTPHDLLELGVARPRPLGRDGTGEFRVKALQSSGVNDGDRFAVIPDSLTEDGETNHQRYFVSYLPSDFGMGIPSTFAGFQVHEANGESLLRFHPWTGTGSETGEPSPYLSIPSFPGLKFVSRGKEGSTQFLSGGRSLTLLGETNGIAQFTLRGDPDTSNPRFHDVDVRMGWGNDPVVDASVDDEQLLLELDVIVNGRLASRCNPLTPEVEGLEDAGCNLDIGEIRSGDTVKMVATDWVGHESVVSRVMPDVKDDDGPGSTPFTVALRASGDIQARPRALTLYSSRLQFRVKNHWKTIASCAQPSRQNGSGRVVRIPRTGKYRVVVRRESTSDVATSRPVRLARSGRPLPLKAARCKL